MEDQRVVVITGASSALGHALARAFAARGDSLVLAARRASLIDDLATECGSDGATAISVRADVGMEDDVRIVASRALDAFGRIDVWINGAGASGMEAAHAAVGLTEQERVIRTNLLGTMYGSHHAMTQFRRQRRGVLVNMASTPTRSAPNTPALAAARFGIVGLGSALRQEIRDTGLWDVHVCTVIPLGPTQSSERLRDGGLAEKRADTDRLVEIVTRLVDHPRDEVVVGRRTAGLAAQAALAEPDVTPASCPGRRAHLVEVDLHSAISRDVTWGDGLAGRGIPGR